jgi:hypothetical protein
MSDRERQMDSEVEEHINEVVEAFKKYLHFLAQRSKNESTKEERGEDDNEKD